MKKLRQLSRADFEPVPAMDGEALIQITGRTRRGDVFVAGLILHLTSGYCVLSAPILRKTCLGRHYATIKETCRARSWGWRCVYQKIPDYDEWKM